MNINDISARCGYLVKALTEKDADIVFDVLKGNTLYYQYHPPFVTKQSIFDDMSALPPGKSVDDKYYVGFFKDEKLYGVMDLIENYPTPGTAFIGFFAVDAAISKKGVGTAIISGIAEGLRLQGFKKLRLAIDKGNPQSKAFWTKNGFLFTGEEYPNDFSSYLPMEKEL